MTPLKTIFDEASQAIKYDERLAARINKYVYDLMNRNEEHVQFFGSNLTGVHALRFKTSDRNEWFIDIMDIDEDPLRKRVLKESSLDKNWVRANDTFNLDCLYTVHRLLRSKLSEKDKVVACENTLKALNIKLMGSILAAYFPYPVDERIAQEVYARLSRKFYIKKLGSWREVFNKRATDTISKESKWYKVLYDFTDDAELAQCISDIQGRLRSMIKYVWDVLAKVRADDAKFNRSKSTIEVEGEQVLQAIKRDGDKYMRYAHSIVSDRNTFIKEEVLTIVDAEMKSCSKKLLLDALEALVVDASNNKRYVEELITCIIQHTIDTIQTDRTAKRMLNDISWILNKEKLLFMASKTNDPNVIRARELSEKLIRGVCKTKNATMIASLKTGLIIYIVGRTFTMDYFTK